MKKGVCIRCGRKGNKSLCTRCLGELRDKFKVKQYPCISGFAMDQYKSSSVIWGKSCIKIS